MQPDFAQAEIVLTDSDALKMSYTQAVIRDAKQAKIVQVVVVQVRVSLNFTSCEKESTAPNKIECTNANQDCEIVRAEIVQTMIV